MRCSLFSRTLAFTTTTGANGVVSLVGTSGVDTQIISALTNEVFIGAQGANDVITVALSTGTTGLNLYTVNGGAGNDTLNFGAANTLTGSVINGDGGTGTAGNDTITLGTISASSIGGNSGNDTITFTNTQNSSVNGNAGNDTITVTAGGSFFSSSLYGGQGNDTITNTAGSTQFVAGVVNGNRGADLITINSDSFSSDSAIYGGQGNDIITVATTAAVTATTGIGNFTVYGDLGDDNITGGNGQDTISGGDGADTITGGGQGDSMTGGAGSDTFVVGAANINALSSITGGGAAAWVFSFGVGGADVVTDFTAGVTASGGDVLNGTLLGATSINYLALGAASAAGGIQLRRGTYSAANGAFTESATGLDVLYAGNGATGGNPTVANTNEYVVLAGAAGAFAAQSYVAANFV